jgi:hypothetical protein
LAILALVGAITVAAQSPKPTRTKMIAVESESVSIILRSAAIVVFRIEAVRPAGVPNQSDVGIRLLQTVKGNFVDPPDSLHRLRVTKHPNNGDTAPVGVWSTVDLEAGKELIAFSRGGASIAEALNDPHCEELVPARDHLADVLFARDAEAAQLPATNIIAMARQHAGNLRYFGAEYVVGKNLRVTLPDPAAFDLLMNLAEAPDLPPESRTCIVESAAFKIADSDQPPMEIVRRAARALLSIAESDSAGAMRSRIFEVLLPAVLHMSSRKPLPAKEIFAMQDAQLFQARDILRKHRAEPGASRLIEWIER